MVGERGGWRRFDGGGDEIMWGGREERVGCWRGERLFAVRGVVGYGEGMADLLTVVEVW